MTPDERLERWALFEARYGPFPPQSELVEEAENHAFLRFCEPLRHVPGHYLPPGMGQG